MQTSLEDVAEALRHLSKDVQEIKRQMENAEG